MQGGAGLRVAQPVGQAGSCWNCAPPAGPGWGTGPRPATGPATGAAALSALLASQARDQPSFDFVGDEGDRPAGGQAAAGSAAIAAPAPWRTQDPAAVHMRPPAHPPPSLQQPQQQVPLPQAAAAKAAPAPPASCTLSLERYLDFLQLLTKGSGHVQQLTELERSVLKANDLKQVLQVGAGSSLARRA